jgi:hypothetical protein
MNQRALVAVILASGLIIPPLNLLVFTRDVPITVGAQTAEIVRVIDDKPWAESPMQTLQTFLPDAIFANIGDSESGTFDFEARLRMVYGDEAVGNFPIVDVRGIFSEDDLQNLKTELFTWGYRSEEPCPHEVLSTCEIYVAWNRERTKEIGIRMITLRFGDSSYAIVDDSAVDEG